MLVQGFFVIFFFKYKQRILKKLKPDCMRLSESIVPFLLVILMPGFIVAQEVKFESNGRISKIDIKQEKDKKKIIFGIEIPKGELKNKIPLFDVTGLSSADQKEKAKIREILLEKIDEAITRLENPNDNLKIVLQEVWTGANKTLADCTNELKLIKGYIQANNKTNGAGLTLQIFQPLITPLDNYLFTASAKIYESEPNVAANESNTLKLWKIDAFNKFIIDYYTATYTDADIKGFSVSKLVAYSQYLSKQYNDAIALCRKIYEANGIVTVTDYGKIVAFLNQLSTAGNTYANAKALLNKDWFKQWIWFKGGDIKLNPLDFSTDEFLKKYPKYDVVKGKIFDEYIDSVLKKFAANDTFGKVEQFKKILALKGTGNETFESAERLKKIEEFNKARSGLLTTKYLLNEITVPEKGEFYSYSAKGKIDAIDNKKEYLTSPIRTDETKTLAIHNVQKGLKADISITSTPIKDQSAFQEQVDTLAGLIGKVAGYATSLSGFGGILSLLTTNAKLPNDIIDIVKQNVGITVVQSTVPGTARGSFRRIETKYFSFTKYLEKYLRDKDIFIQKTFDIIIALPKFSGDNNERVGDNEMPSAAFQMKMDDFIAEYLKKYKTDQTATISQLSKDSSILSQLYPVFANSTLPPKKLEEEKDEVPAYSSVIVDTKTSDDAVKKDINVFAFKAKEADTTKIDKFSYKVGKNHRFQFSAGLAYTFSNFVQSIAKEENGTILITNTAQQYRLSVGVHIHWGRGLFLQDNRFLGNFWERSSVYVGVGIPKPLENIYLGYSYDLFPGLKTIAGAHIYRNDKYNIQNNAIIDKRMRYAYAGPFFAIQIDPSSLLKAFNFIGKKS